MTSRSAAPPREVTTGLGPDGKRSDADYAALRAGYNHAGVAHPPGGVDAETDARESSRLDPPPNPVETANSCVGKIGSKSSFTGCTTPTCRCSALGAISVRLWAR